MPDWETLKIIIAIVFILCWFLGIIISTIWMNRDLWRERYHPMFKFLKAVKKGNITFVRDQLDEKIVRINEAGEHGDTALHVAARNGQMEMFHFLTANGASIKARNKYDETPLHSAVEEGNFEIAKLLVEAGADINARDDDKASIINYAAMYGFTEVLRYLLEIGADATVKDANGLAPIHYAAQLGNAEMCRLLLDAGIDPKTPGDEGQTPEQIAIINKHFAVAKLFGDVQK